MNKSKRVFGIDLGTTNSAISVVDNSGISNIIPLSNNRSTLPSCVSWMGGDKFVVGVESYNMRWTENTIYSVKKLMGTDKLITLKYEGEERVFTPAEISSRILRALCDEIEDMYGKVEDVIITVPAKFNNKQIGDTIEAGRLAGLNVLSTLREPTSASLCYELSSKDKMNKSNNLLVYDLGGGTFDISFLEVIQKKSIPSLDELYGFPHIDESTIYKVLKTEGSTSLGGDDIDSKAFEYLCEKYPFLNTDITEQTKEELILSLEEVKKESISLLEKKVPTKNGNVVEIEISEHVINRAVDYIYNITKGYLNRFLTKKDKEKIESITLVGGSTKSTRLVKNLERDFPEVFINDMLNPDESVAIGAGIHGNEMAKKEGKVQLFDVLPLAIGIATEGKIDKIIPRNLQVPCSRVKPFMVKDLSMDYINIHLYQGTSVIIEDSTYIGSIQIENVKELTNGTGRFTVELNVNSDGFLGVKVKFANETKEYKLLNLFNNSTKAVEDITVNIDERLMKKLNRWTSFAKRLDNKKDSKELLELINLVKQGKKTEEDVVNKLTVLRKVTA